MRKQMRTYFVNCNLKPNEGRNGGGINISPAAAAYWWSGVMLRTTPEGLSAPEFGLSADGVMASMLVKKKNAIKAVTAQ